MNIEDPPFKPGDKVWVTKENTVFTVNKTYTVEDCLWSVKDKKYSVKIIGRACRREPAFFKLAGTPTVKVDPDETLKKVLKENSRMLDV